VPLQALEIDGNAVFEFDAQRVVAAARLDDRDVITRTHDALGKQEAGREVLIVTRGAHGDGHARRLPLAVRFVAKANFQWLLDGNPVVDGFAQLPAHFRNVYCLAPACHAAFFRHYGRAVYRSGGAFRT